MEERKITRTLKEGAVAFLYCLLSWWLPAEHGSAVLHVTLLLRQWVLSYFFPLKTSNTIFPNHVEEMEKQMNKPRKRLGKVFSIRMTL